MALGNSWLLYRELEIIHGNNKPLDLLNFCDEVGDALLLSSSRALSSSKNAIGRPRRSSDQPHSEPPPQNRKTTEWRPCSDVRYDEVRHWPILVGGIGKRCKLEKCTGQSRIQCEKCKVSLCLNQDKNCFKKFHIKYNCLWVKNDAVRFSNFLLIFEPKLNGYAQTLKFASSCN